MTKIPSLIPHQVIADWIQANDVHVLKDAQKPLITAFDDTNLDLFDYSLASRRAHKAQAEAVAQVFRVGRSSVYWSPLCRALLALFEAN